jgi:2,3-bisphosphoglycerate-independent phosphoglycerate mutase
MAAFLGIPAYKLASNAALGLAGLTGAAVGDNLLNHHQSLNRERLEQNRQVQNGLLKAHAAQMYAQPDRANLAQMQQQLVAEQNLNRGTAMQVPGEAFNEWKNRILQAERANLERTAEQGNGGTPTSFQQYQNQYR